MQLELLDKLLCPYVRTPLALESYERHGDDIEYGVLRSEAGEFPIVAGIPILFADRADLLALLRAGRLQEATALAVFGEALPAGLWRVAGLLRQTYRLRKLGAALENSHQGAWLRRTTAALFPPGEAPGPRRLFDLAFREFRIRSSEVFNYNFYRHGQPGYFVALSFVERVRGPRVLDLACGAGHLTRMLCGRAPQVVALDGFFFYLYVSRQCIARGAWQVCADVNALPFREAAFDDVFCSDAFFNFQGKWAALREMERVLSPAGRLMLVWLRSRLHHHLYPGRALTPAGYRVLVAHLPHRIIPDDQTLQRYLARQGAAAAIQADDAALNRARSVSMLVDRAGEFADGGRFALWPHVSGQLHVNPLYKPMDGRYVRRWPSAFYADEDPVIRDYLPENFMLSPEQEAALREGRFEVLDMLDGLIGRGAILGLPEGFLR